MVLISSFVEAVPVVTTGGGGGVSPTSPTIDPKNSKTWPPGYSLVHGDTATGPGTSPAYDDNEPYTFVPSSLASSVTGYVSNSAVTTVGGTFIRDGNSWERNNNNDQVQESYTVSGNGNTVYYNSDPIKGSTYTSSSGTQTIADGLASSASFDGSGNLRIGGRPGSLSTDGKTFTFSDNRGGSVASSGQTTIATDKDGDVTINYPNGRDLEFSGAVYDAIKDELPENFFSAEFGDFLKDNRLTDNHLIGLDAEGNPVFQRGSNYYGYDNDKFQKLDPKDVPARTTTFDEIHGELVTTTYTITPTGGREVDSITIDGVEVDEQLLDLFRQYGRNGMDISKDDQTGEITAVIDLGGGVRHTTTFSGGTVFKDGDVESGTRTTSTTETLYFDDKGDEVDEAAAAKYSIEQETDRTDAIYGGGNVNGYIVTDYFNRGDFVLNDAGTAMVWDGPHRSADRTYYDGDGDVDWSKSYFYQDTDDDGTYDTYVSYNADGDPSEKGDLTPEDTNDDGKDDGLKREDPEDFDDKDPKDQTLKDDAATAQDYASARDFFDALDYAIDTFSGLGGFSNLFDNYEQQRQDRLDKWDNFFCRDFQVNGFPIMGGIGCWISDFCSHHFDKTSGGSANVITPDGMIQSVAHVEAERSSPITYIDDSGNEVTEYLYKITWFVQANVDSDEDYNNDAAFNVQLRGERTVNLYSGDIYVGEGESSSALEEFALVQYTNYYYDSICIIFSNKLRFRDPVEGDEEVDHLCNGIISSDSSASNYQASGGGGTNAGSGTNGTTSSDGTIVQLQI